MAVVVADGSSCCKRRPSVFSYPVPVSCDIYTWFEFACVATFIACRYPRGNGIGVDLAAEGIGKDLKGTPLEVG